MSVFSLVARFWLTAERSFQVPRSLSRSSADERETDDSRINNASVMLNAITRPLMGFLLAALHAFVGQRVHNGGYRIARRMSGHGRSRTELQSARASLPAGAIPTVDFLLHDFGRAVKKLRVKSHDRLH